MRVNVVHLVGGLDRGGIERWLLGLVRLADRSRWSHHVLTRSPGPFALDAAFAAEGVPVAHCPGHPLPWRFAANLRRACQERATGLLHSHLDLFSGQALAAVGERVPVRLAHLHNAPQGPHGRSLATTAMAPFHRAWLRRHATVGIVVGSQVGTWAFGADWHADPRWHLIPCGADLAAAAPAEARDRLRAEFGFTAGALVVGHVGRFAPQKNQGFLLDLLPLLPAHAALLLVGDGAELAHGRDEAARRGLSGRVRFTGARDDVPALLSAMDVFAMPSHYEGFGVAAVEAQAAGLPCVLSDQVAVETVLDPATAQRLPLDLPAWAEAVRRMAALPRPDPALARSRIAAAALDLPGSVRRVEALYAEAVA